ncbi:MAG TPA: laccase domain-containing protein, partial [Microthrixaceae bacterium]|nr:laccase domain-containing protein [Microthrixaceae bacterium]
GVGPAIPADRYQVGDDVSVAASECFGREVGMVLQADGTGRWLFDTWKANLLVLRDSGVLADNVALAALSTGEGRFFSDREARPCGRFAALAKLNH